MLYILDSAAILNDSLFSFSKQDKYMTTDSIVAEMRDLRSRALVNAAVSDSRLKIQNPEEKTINAVKERSAKDGFRLSRADLSILALAVEMKRKKRILTLITDDRSVQNFCLLFKIRFLDVLRGRINETIAFERRCSGCSKLFPQETKLKECDICGLPIERKVKKAP